MKIKEKIGKTSKEKNIPIIFLIHPVFEGKKNFQKIFFNFTP